jgi:hypothetical protein
LITAFGKTWKEATFTLPKASKGPKSPQDLRPVSLLSITGKLFGKVILKRTQTNLVSVPDITRCMRLTDVPSNFNNNMSRAAEFLGIEKAYGKKKHVLLAHYTQYYFF